MAKSEFETWFIEQFGKCPMSNAAALKLESKAMDIERQANQIRYELKMLREWHANWRAARYAWNAKERKGG